MRNKKTFALYLKKHRNSNVITGISKNGIQRKNSFFFLILNKNVSNNLYQNHPFLKRIICAKNISVSLLEIALIYF